MQYTTEQLHLEKKFLKKKKKEEFSFTVIMLFLTMKPLYSVHHQIKESTGI